MLIIGHHTREVQFPPVINDGEWSTIAQLSGLPPEARFTIDELIGLYRQLRADASAYYGTLWEKLRLARDKEAESLRGLDDLIADQDVSAAIAMGLDGQLQIPSAEMVAVHRRLQQSRKDKQQMIDWYDQAIKRVHRAKPGPRGGRDSPSCTRGTIERTSQEVYGQANISV